MPGALYNWLFKEGTKDDGSAARHLNDSIRNQNKTLQDRALNAALAGGAAVAAKTLADKISIPRQENSENAEFDGDEIPRDGIVINKETGEQIQSEGIEDTASTSIPNPSVKKAMNLGESFMSDNIGSEQIIDVSL